MEHISPILVDKVVTSRYWKERAFALNELSLVDRVMLDVQSVGVVFGAHNRPTPFFCLLVKLLQMKPDVESVRHFVTLTHGPVTDDPEKRKDLRYLRVLGAFYLRLTLHTSPDLYTLLEPLYADCRQVNVVQCSGEAQSLSIDAIVDWLLAQKSQTVLGLGLPVIVRRFVHEKRKKLKPYQSFLSDVTEAEELQARKELAALKDADIGNFQSAFSMSVDETNSLRAKLGLKPLRL